MAEAADNKPAGGGSPMKLVITMIVGAILLVAVSIGGVFFMMKSMGMLGGGGAGGHAPAAEAEHSGPAMYLPLEPAFVVNFKEKGKNRFLQVSIEIMARDPQILEEVKLHMPVIRNNVLLYLGGLTAEDFNSTEGKEKIRAELLVQLKAFLKEETGHDNVEGLYFTSFVTQ
ncbi:MAG: flagellar basal body-associated FliL family protein [Gammaproteobacteria bacterium]|nr:flagellar basal body-associated FliL family protein [Gammaproteobacteria bacterium]